MNGKRLATRMALGLVLELTCLLAGAQAASKPLVYVWWEGERPSETNFPGHSWFSPGGFKPGKRELLSDGDWLNVGERYTGKDYFARYPVAVPEGGKWSLWVRKFWKHGPFKWRFDRQAWQTCGRNIALIDRVTIRKHLEVNWVCLGEVKLTKGKHEFEVRLIDDPLKNTIACFDCFVLAKGPYLPRANFRPGQRSKLTLPGYWAFDPVSDSFGKAALDLRRLNENEAGQSGYVRRKGAHLLLGNGKRVRFWGVNCGRNVVRLGGPSQDYVARRLAKVGVNIVRIHAPLWKEGGLDQRRVDPEFLDSLQGLVAALKRQGIYTHLSFFFPMWFRVRKDYWIDGYENIGNKNPYSLLFFNETVQRIHRGLARKLLTAPNPHTGVALGKDPAVAMVEIINEDSFLFWTFNQGMLPKEQREELEQIFGKWLKSKYGSLSATRRRWGGVKHPDDRPYGDRMGVFDAWHLTRYNIAKVRNRKRFSDQLEFFIDLQRDFYKGFVRFCRKELGYKGLMVCGNWKTADPKYLDALERYSYTAGDVIDRHGYFGGEHKGPRQSYAVDVGDTFKDRAGVYEPWELPIAIHQIDGYPQIISEIGWPNPNRYKAEFPFLCAVYGDLDGLDGFEFFSIHGPGWETVVEKFALSTPDLMGQFPATALLYRRGDVTEGAPVFREILSLPDLYAFKGTAQAEPANFDDLRQPGVKPPPARDRESSLDPRAFFVGPVLRRFGVERSLALKKDLSPYIDRKEKTIRSETGQVTWDYGKGLVTANTPRCQGATGFLKRAGDIALGQAVIRSDNEFGAVIVIALDDKPLNLSKRVLIQAMTESKPFGWRVRAGKIVSLGEAPMLVRDIHATVTLKWRPAPSKITALDPHGYPQATLRAVKIKDGVRIDLPKDAAYTVVEW